MKNLSPHLINIDEDRLTIRCGEGQYVTFTLDEAEAILHDLPTLIERLKEEKINEAKQMIQRGQNILARYSKRADVDPKQTATL